MPAETSSSSLPEYLTLLEAASVLRTHPATVRRWVRCGVLPSRKLPGARGRYLIPRDAISAILSSVEKPA